MTDSKPRSTSQIDVVRSINEYLQQQGRRINANASKRCADRARDGHLQNYPRTAVAETLGASFPLIELGHGQATATCRVIAGQHRPGRPSPAKP